MFIPKKGHQPGVYVPLRALFLVFFVISLSQTAIKFWHHLAQVGEPSPRFFQYFGIQLIRFSIFRAKRVKLTGYRFYD